MTRHLWNELRARSHNNWRPVRERERERETTAASWKCYNSDEEEEWRGVLSVLSQAESLMDFKTYFAAETLMTSNNETTDTFSHQFYLPALLESKLCCHGAVGQIIKSEIKNWMSRNVLRVLLMTPNQKSLYFLPLALQHQQH